RIAAAAAYGDDGRTIARIDVDAIVADAARDERDRRRVDFVGLVAMQPPHVQAQRALRQFDLREFVLEIEKVETRVVIEMQGRRADLELGACIRVGPELVARYD